MFSFVSVSVVDMIASMFYATVKNWSLVFEECPISPTFYKRVELESFARFEAFFSVMRLPFDPHYPPTH